MKKFLWVLFWLVFIAVFVYGAWYIWNKIQEDTKPVAQNATIVVITPSVSNSTVPSPNISSNQTTVAPLPPGAPTKGYAFPSANVTPHMSFGGDVSKAPHVRVAPDPPMPLPVDRMIDGWGIIKVTGKMYNLSTVKSLSLTLSYTVNGQQVGPTENITLLANGIYYIKNEVDPGLAAVADIKIVVVELEQ